MDRATTHRDVLRRLSAAEKRQLTARSDVRGLVHLAGHVAIIAAFLGLNLTSDGWIRAGAVLCQGSAMVFLFTAMHECSQSTAFRSRWLNRAVGASAGLLLLISPRWFFHFHQDHHKFTQDPARDPELATPKPDRMAGHLWHLSGLPFWYGNLTVLVGNAMAHRHDPYVPSARRSAVVWEARSMLVTYAILLPSLALADLLVSTLLLPLIVGQPFLRAYLLAEHAGCEETNGNMLVNTRTLLTMAPVRFLAWNMPFHTEHHSFPAVPFHALPRLHRVMRDDLYNLEPGYLSFHRGFLHRLAPPFRQG